MLLLKTKYHYICNYLFTLLSLSCSFPVVARGTRRTAPWALLRSSRVGSRRPGTAFPRAPLSCPGPRTPQQPTGTVSPYCSNTTAGPVSRPPQPCLVMGPAEPGPSAGPGRCPMTGAGSAPVPPAAPAPWQVPWLPGPAQPPSGSPWSLWVPHAGSDPHLGLLAKPCLTAGTREAAAACCQLPVGALRRESLLRTGHRQLWQSPAPPVKVSLKSVEAEQEEIRARAVGLRPFSLRALF